MASREGGRRRHTTKEAAKRQLRGDIEGRKSQKPSGSDSSLPSRGRRDVATPPLVSGYDIAGTAKAMRKPSAQRAGSSSGRRGANGSVYGNSGDTAGRRKEPNPGKGQKGPKKANSANGKKASNAKKGQASKAAPQSNKQNGNSVTVKGLARGAALTAGSALGRGVASLWRRSKLATSVIFVALLLICVSLIGSAIPTNKLYDGVHIGSIDVSGMTLDEAASAVEGAYNPNLRSTSVYIFADEEAANSVDIELKRLEDESIAEQISFEEAQQDKKLWVASADSLEAYIPSYDLAQAAFDECAKVGFFPRLFGAAKNISIEPRADFNETLLGNLISDINATLGTPVEDFGVELDEGYFLVTEGHEGELLDNEKFASLLSSKLIEDDSNIVEVIAEVEFTPYKVDFDDAELTRKALDVLIPEQIHLLVGEEDYAISGEEIARWVSTEPIEENGEYFLNPFIDHRSASNDILSIVNLGDASTNVNVRFTKGDDGTVYVKPETEVVVPNVEQAVSQLDEAVFSDFRSTKSATGPAEVEPIEVTTVEHPDSFTVDEALSYGVVTRFSSFTTQFTSTNSTANRTFNVHHAADLIDNSIVLANGGQWSFNVIAGSCDEENGFLAAKVIESGNYTEGVGGGVCQVATTVFNAAYEAGLPIVERKNHSLYSSSYPAGRDAAISYPEPDLIWANPTTSDILLVTEYTSVSVTVTLIGCDPNLSVETETGEWIEGIKHTTKYEEDETLSANASYIKTAGTDGMGITVVRTVTDADGNVVSKDTFKSNYAPINRVIAFGPGSDMDALVQKYQEETNQ